ncbi:MAG: hypothetical protein AAB295_05320, partial [Chloroflexota bacterium]
MLAGESRSVNPAAPPQIGQLAPADDDDAHARHAAEPLQHQPARVRQPRVRPSATQRRQGAVEVGKNVNFGHSKSSR